MPKLPSYKVFAAITNGPALPEYNRVYFPVLLANVAAIQQAKAHIEQTITELGTRRDGWCISFSYLSHEGVERLLTVWDARGIVYPPGRMLVKM